MRMNYLISPRYSINKRGGKRQPSSKQPQAIIQIKENLVMSTLFTAVSVEQQAIVAGGNGFTIVAPDVEYEEKLNYSAIGTNLGGYSVAGPHGAYTSNGYWSGSIQSSVKKELEQTFYSY